jgi:hypothetical protein
MEDGNHDLPQLTDAQWDRFSLMYAFLTEDKEPTQDDDEGGQAFQTRFQAWREEIRKNRPGNGERA